ncbi:exo-beta-D-glucosaminidase [Streptomyces sp. NBC_00083]|uniref:glycoside hydrolase family 2 protein n=1 Tax=Streptomyces sp. NBC_00083 TaxID=2975647 RepID=UPI00224E674E|nr:exo-beta-D-glucosaminidase [Streptomyces sp. NBC_00083]MCX5384575.1 exo-beta-D-glucosaminidase [Streptomyces sp. NBC_00083]
MAAAAPAAASTDRPPPSFPAPTVVSSTAGSATALTGYAIQSTAKVTASAAAVSSPGFRTDGWHRAAPRSTVLAALVADGTYPDPFYSTNQQRIPSGAFTTPWWYRGDFTLADTRARAYLDFSGVVSAADVYLNGRRIVDAGTAAGLYRHHEVDITALVRAGVNTVAFRVQPNDPRRHFTVGWLDWLQPPPDANMGIVRDVLVRRRGPVALHDAHVLTDLSVPSLGSAELTVKAQVRNDSRSTTTTTVTAVVATAPPAPVLSPPPRGGGAIVMRRRVTLRPGETGSLVFGPDDHPQLRLRRPAVWWPAGMGPQNLYGLSLTATVAGRTADATRHTFGIRDVKAPLNSEGARQYAINGRPLLIRGGGWSPDQLLRWDTVGAEDRITAALDAGLNTLRLEGRIEPDEFFELADRHGILTLPGWECCDKWEAQVNHVDTAERWTGADRLTARASMAAEAARLRDHPSVLSFLIGSDYAPDLPTEREYLAALRAADWRTPVVPAASDTTTPLSGRSGMRMTGPYDWVPPAYWYDKREGGASGFNSETSAGPSIPTLDTLRRTLSPAELDILWTKPSAPQYHRSPSRTFQTLGLFNSALAHRYGAPRSLADYTAKAQLAQYENVRAQFEAYARNASDATAPATGVIYWMFNSGWTSLHWQLVDRYLDEGGAYYGAKKANEPLHIQYAYDDRSVAVVNRRPVPAAGLTADVALFSMDGTRHYHRVVHGIRVRGDGAKTTVLTLPAHVRGLSGTFLARLTLRDRFGREVSRNVYWLSGRQDTLDYDATDWYYTPTTGYADLTGLNSLAPAADMVATAHTVRHPGALSTTTVTLRNVGARGRTAGTPALMTDVHLVDRDGAPLLPVRWSDNHVSLWPGESTALTATYRTPSPRHGLPRIRLSGWNTPTRYLTPSR